MPLRLLAILTLLLSLRAATAQPLQIYTVNSTADTVIGTCTALHCTLREAILAANGDQSPSEIRFDFSSGVAPFTIAVNSALPNASSNLTIDALAGNGYSPGDVVMDGSAVSGFVSGLRIDSNTKIYGLQIQGFPNHGITGTNSTLSNVTLGAPGKGNILIQNDSAGAFFFFLLDTLRAQGNFIGTNPLFAEGLGNGSHGIVVGSIGMTAEIGGIDTVQSNVICSNGKFGVKLNGSGNFNIRGNAIGTNPAGTAANLGNADGIEISGHVSGVAVIGGTGNAANRIAHNAGRGVVVATGSNNVRITRNRIFCNSLAGIQLNGNANNSISPLADANFNALTPAAIGGTGVNGQVIEVFKSDTTGCSGGVCQGKIFLGADTVSGGAWSIMPLVSLASGDQITATRTSGNNTSAFSNCQTVCFEPSATLTGNAVICQGDTANLFISASGLAPLTIFYTANGVPQPPLTNVPGTSFGWQVSPAQTTVYQLVGISDAFCQGTATGIGQVNVLPVPGGSLLGGGDYCTGDSVQLQFALSGAPPFSVALNNGIGTVNLDNLQNGHTLNVFPPEGSTAYTLLSVTDSIGCTTMLNDTATVSVNSPPMVNSTGIFCEENDYDVEISLAGSPPLFANGVAVQGNLVSYVSLPAGSDFSVLISNACGDTTVASENNCFACFTSAGAFQGDTVEVCEGASVVAQHFGEALQDGDVLVFVLTSSLPPAPGNAVAVSVSPSFSYTASLALDVPYFLSALAGKNSGSGMVDWNDPCLDVAPPVVVIFHEKPEDPYWLQGENSLCGGDTLHLEAGYYADPAFDYLWLLPSGDTATSDEAFWTIPGVGATDTGRYYVLARLGGCYSNPLGYHRVEVFYPDANESKAGEDFSLCELPLSVTISATAPPDGCTSSWLALDKAVLADANAATTEVSDLKAGSNRFLWQVTCPGCGTVVEDTLTVVWEKPPVLVNDTFTLEKASQALTMNVFLNDRLEQYGSLAEMEVSIISQSDMGSVAWQASDSSFVFEESTGTFRGEVRFQYAVCREGSDCPGSCDTAEVLIRVLNLPDVPGGITPFNNDGVNDYLDIAGLSEDLQVEIVIANRWGSVVFRENDYKNESAWRGEYKGGLLPPGAYFYQMRVHGLKKPYEESGVVHLIDLEK